ncbi:MAG TPA: DUF2950 domain-containing protein [Terracidiphilus sp.]
MSRKLLKFEVAGRLVILALAIPLASCHKTETASTPTAFATPEEAGDAVQASAKSGNQDELMAIFGPDAKQLLYSGDPVQDKNALQSFTAEYSVMHRWRKMKDGSRTLLVGADNFPFPIPLKKNSSGQWLFDTAAGKNEILNRRIGRNELAVIDVCNALVDAEGQYHAQPHDGAAKGEFALKFISDPGKQNGLYWKSDNGQPESPLGPRVTQAAAEGYTKNANGPTPFHGYLFKILTGQSAKAPGGAKDYVVNGKMVGGFAFVAYPASYGDSGIMTFITNQDGLLLQKDLGTNTAQAASAMTIYDPDTGWDPIPEPPGPQ